MRTTENLEIRSHSRQVPEVPVAALGVSLDRNQRPVPDLVHDPGTPVFASAAIASTSFPRQVLSTVICLLAAAYYLPLIGITMSLNFPYWDVFMDPYVCLKPPQIRFGPILANLRYSAFADPLQYRPTSVFLLNLQYLAFGGEFWAWYLVRWLLFFATTWILYLALRRVTGFAPAIIATAFFLFHQEPFVTDVMAVDAYAAFFGALVLYYLVRTSGCSTTIFDLSTRTWLQHLGLFVLWLLASGTKEVMVPLLGAVLLAFLAEIVRRRSSVAVLLLWLTLCLPLGFAAYRITSVHHPCVGATIYTEGWSQAVRDHYAFTASELAPHAFPHSPGHVLLYLAIAVVAVGLVASFRRPWRLAMIAVLVLALAGCAFVLIQSGPYTKYLPLPVLLMTWILGLCLASLWELFKQLLLRNGRSIPPAAKVIATAFGVATCLLYPACTISDTYSQYFGLVQCTYEMADVVNFMEQRLGEGYACAITGLTDNPKELPPEKGNHFKFYFERFGQEFYGRPMNTHILELVKESTPAGPFVLLTNLGPERITAGELRHVGIADLSRVEGIFQFGRTRYGFFERLVSTLIRFEALIGNTHYPAIAGQLPQPLSLGQDLPNPAYSRFPWWPPQAGPHLLYMFSSKPQRDPQTPVPISMVVPFHRYGAFGR